MPEKIKGMESEDKRINQLTQISNAPANGVLLIDVPGSTTTNGITVDNLANTMPIAASDRNGIMSSDIYNKTIMEKPSILNMNDITKSGVYQISSACSNIPEGSWSIAIVFRAAGYILQLITGITDPTRLYIRTSSDDGGVYSEWSRFSFV